jgi:hypothetical protein
LTEIKMARYMDALQWIADNDDTDFMQNDDWPNSVTLSLVADLFNKTDERARADLAAVLLKTDLALLRASLKRHA